MDDKSRIQLDKLIREYEPEETTSKIRTLKHSKKIRDNITILENLKKTHSRTMKTSPEVFKTMARKQCSFLYDNYTNIFNRLLKDEIDLSIMAEFLKVLYNIEEGILDQHEGSFKIGTILKELYIDSALKQSNKRELSDSKKGKVKKSVKVTNKNIDWKTYKLLHTMD